MVTHLIEAATAFVEEFRHADPIDQIFSSRQFDINMVTSHETLGYGWQLIAYEQVGTQAMRRVATVGLVPGDARPVADVNPEAEALVPDLAHVLHYQALTWQRKAAA